MQLNLNPGSAPDISDDSTTPSTSTAVEKSRLQIEAIDPALADTVVEYALGGHREDMNWAAYKVKFSYLIKQCSTFRRGEKNGTCLTQGSLITGSRKAPNMIRNTILMVDCDTGESLDEIEAKIRQGGFCALAWTTYSHLKPVTHVAEKKLTHWTRKNKIDLDEGGPVEAVRDYLSSTGKVKDSILDSITAVKREHADGGIRFAVHHDPMPRVRVLFLLKEPFEFTKGGTQDERIALWKEKYKAVSETLGLAYDASCVDPSRLMYMPAISPDADESQHEIRWINGEPLDLAKVSRPNAVLAAFSNASAHAGSGKLHLHTPGLAKFLKEHGSDFNAAEFLRTYAGEDIREDTTDKVHCCCPNDDAHTDAGNPDDKGFFATDAISGNGWTMHCMHASCITESSEANGGNRPDRAWFLDKSCQKYGVESADDLLPFTNNYDPAAERRDVTITRQDDSIAKLRLDIESLTEGSSGHVLDDVLRRIAEHPPSMTVDDMVSDVVARAKRTRAAIGAALQAHRRAAKTAQEALSNNAIGGTIRHEPPSDDEIETSNDHARVTTIYSNWDHKDQLRVARNAFARENKRNPTIFVKPEGGQVRTKAIDGRLFLEECGDSKAMWTAELNNALTFKRVTEDGAMTTPPWDSIVTEFTGSNRIDLPTCRGVATVPVFASDGELITERGYNPKTKMYLVPSEAYLDVPDIPTDDEVADAMAILFEPLRDFPFTDVFDGSDKLPIRLEPPERDADGFPLPNWDRGYVSRLHTVAMILQPFMRDMIDGHTPIYHIDKAAPGTGAGYLIDLTQFIFTGQHAVSGTYTANQDEFRKELFASLRKGSTALIFDNVKDHVDDPALAQALTSDHLRGRILGQSTETEVPNRATWVFAGNNLTFSGEMTRRICPIRMDANLPNPDQERLPEHFKHRDVIGWVKANRLKLVRACHILIRNWIAKGRPKATAVLASFEDWSRVMGGVFENAGYPGFLGTIAAYQAAKNDEKSSATAYVSDLWERHQCSHFTLAQAYETGCQPIAGDLPSHGEPKWQHDEIPVNGRDAHGRASSLSSYMLKHMVGRTYRLSGELVKLTTSKPGNKRLYKFERVAT